MKCCKGFGGPILCILCVAFGVGLITALIFPLRFIVLLSSLAVIILGIVALAK